MARKLEEEWLKINRHDNMREFTSEADETSTKYSNFMNLYMLRDDMRDLAEMNIIQEFTNGDLDKFFAC